MHLNKIIRLKTVLCIIMALVFAFSPIMLTTASAAGSGDVNADKKVNSADALMVLQHATQIIVLNDTQKISADVNGDGKINSTDALEILQHAVGNQSAVFEGYWGTVTAEPTLRLRRGPSTSTDELDKIPYKTKLFITEQSNGWGKTTYNNKTGWVSLEYIQKPEGSGTFTVVSYGWGHGVGMSQEGARYYAKNGWTYDKILLHYYYSSKTKIVKDSAMPKTVTYGGKAYDLKKYLAGSVYAEIGDYSNIEAIKAQAVAIYTYAKYYGFNVKSSTHAYKEYNYSGTTIEKAINAVLGQYISYDGKAILSVYCASMGGKNTSAQSTWLGTDYEYLRGGRTSPESESITKRTYVFTADEIKSMVKSNLDVELSGDPSKWFTNIVHDKSISDSVGYIISMNVGGKTVKGESVRTKLFGYEVRSHCLSIKYNP